MSYYHDDHWQEFESAIEKCSFTGNRAWRRVHQLTNRVQEKRLKTVTRLLNETHKLGCRVEFCSERDRDENNPFVGNEGCRGLYTECDSWIYLNIDEFKSWKMFEEVLAHEAVHLTQNVVYKGHRNVDDHSMEVSMDRIWKFYDSEKYRSWLDSVSDEEMPVYEVEAYSEMTRPRGVACSLEQLRLTPALWEGTYYCPISD
jgi:hypothetical protein